MRGIHSTDCQCQQCTSLTNPVTDVVVADNRNPRETTVKPVTEEEFYVPVSRDGEDHS